MEFHFHSPYSEHLINYNSDDSCTIENQGVQYTVSMPYAVMAFFTIYESFQIEKTCRSFEIHCNLETDESKLLLDSLLTKGTIIVKDVTLELLSSISNIAIELNYPLLKEYILSYTRSIETTIENYEKIFEYTNRLGDYSQVLEFIIQKFNKFSEEQITNSIVKFGNKFAVDLFSSTKLTVNNENQVANVLMKAINLDKSFSCALDCLYLEWIADWKLKELFDLVEKENLVPKTSHFFRSLETFNTVRPLLFNAKYPRNVTALTSNGATINKVAVISADAQDATNSININGANIPIKSLVGTNYIFDNVKLNNTKYIQY